MKNIGIITFIFFIVCFSRSHAQITIVVNRGNFQNVEEAATGEAKVDWSDATHPDVRACTECFAATELAGFLKKCKNIEPQEFRFADPKSVPEKGDVFIIGSRLSNPIINKIIPNKSSKIETDQSFSLFAFKENNRTITVIEGGDRTGTLYGVYSYLEKLGFSFFGLGEKGIGYPEKMCSLPDQLDITENPSFLSRGFKGLYNRGDQEILYWMARNKLNYTESSETDYPLRKKLGLLLMGGEHDIQLQISPQKEYPYNHPSFKGDEQKTKDIYSISKEYMGDADKDGKLTYFEAHPEWYGLRNGKRSNNIGTYLNGDNFCTSNADARSELAKNVVEGLIDGQWKNTDILDLWMFDNGKWCECDNCKKQGNFSDRLLDLAYSLQKEIQKAQQEKRLNRRVIVSTLAYHETLPPPEKALPPDFDYKNFFVTFFVIERCYVHALADPACTEINGFLHDNYKAWLDSKCSYKGDLAIGEYYNVSRLKSLPIVYPRMMATDIPWYYKTGTRHIHYMHTPTSLWGPWTLNQYLFAKLTWNANSATDQLLNEYFTRYYPSTAESTRQFYEHLETTFSNFKPFKHYAGEAKYNMRGRLYNDNMEIFPLDHLRYEEHHSLINDGPDVVEMVDELQLARKQLDISLLACTDSVERARLIEDDLRFVYGETMLYFYYHLIRTAMLHRRSEVALAKNEFAKVEVYAEKLKNIVDVVAPPEGDTYVMGANAINGFEAADVTAGYSYFKQRYGRN